MTLFHLLKNFFCTDCWNSSTSVLGSFFIGYRYRYNAAKTAQYNKLIRYICQPYYFLSLTKKLPQFFLLPQSEYGAQESLMVIVYKLLSTHFGFNPLWHDQSREKVGLKRKKYRVLESHKISLHVQAAISLSRFEICAVRQKKHSQHQRVKWHQVTGKSEFKKEE